MHISTQNLSQIDQRAFYVRFADRAINSLPTPLQGWGECFASPAVRSLRSLEWSDQTLKIPWQEAEKVLLRATVEVAEKRSWVFDREIRKILASLSEDQLAAFLHALVEKELESGGLDYLLPLQRHLPIQNLSNSCFQKMAQEELDSPFVAERTDFVEVKSLLRRLMQLLADIFPFGGFVSALQNSLRHFHAGNGPKMYWEHSMFFHFWITLLVVPKDMIKTLLVRYSWRTSVNITVAVCVAAFVIPYLIRIYSSPPSLLNGYTRNWTEIADNFDNVSGRDDELEKIIDSTRPSAERRHIFIKGTTGRGKSTLLKAATKKLKEKYSSRTVYSVPRSVWSSSPITPFDALLNMVEQAGPHAKNMVLVFDEFNHIDPTIQAQARDFLDNPLLREKNIVCWFAAETKYADGYDRSLRHERMLYEIDLNRGKSVELDVLAIQKYMNKKMGVFVDGKEKAAKIYTQAKKNLSKAIKRIDQIEARYKSLIDGKAIERVIDQTKILNGRLRHVASLIAKGNQDLALQREFYLLRNHILPARVKVIREKLTLNDSYGINIV